MQYEGCSSTIWSQSNDSAGKGRLLLFLPSYCNYIKRFVLMWPLVTYSRAIGKTVCGTVPIDYA